MAEPKRFGAWEPMAVHTPVNDGWRIISTYAAAPKRFSAVAVWTGRDVLLWGGADVATSGAFYRP